MDGKNFGKSLPSVFGNFDFKEALKIDVASLKKHLVIFALFSLITLLLVCLTSVAIVITPDKDALPKSLPAIVTAPLPDEVASDGSGALMPSATVWYHGVRIGNFESDRARVSDILESFNITLSENDVLNVSPSDGIFYGMTIKIDEVIWEDVNIVEIVPFETVEIPCQTIPKGTRQVSVEGVNGEAGKLIHAKKVNGKIMEGETLEETYYKAPVTEEILVGVGGEYTAPDGTLHNYSYYIDVEATAYTHTGNLTYTETVARVGVIAVDPRNIALGSKVYVIGDYGDYGVCSAEDIGGGIKGARIDVFLDTEEECVLFGRRPMRCYVLE